MPPPRWPGLLAAALALSACCGPRYPAGTPHAPAEYAARATALRERAPPGFTTVIVPPFVVIGDGPPEGVRDDAERVVRWAATSLKAEYFDRDPGDILDVWLFTGEESYLRNVSTLFGEIPPTPYGYYSPCDRALLMNVATGYGTLVHEMVHAFMAANFPDCPTWFNEGLASLYEQPSEVEGRIHGGTNWRLAGLQRAIPDRVPTFEALLSTSRRGFYGDGQGERYAAARYLCYYLQEKGLLQRFYRRFRERHAADPTGLATLREVLGEPELTAFQQKWERFVVELTYERGSGER